MLNIRKKWGYYSIGNECFIMLYINVTDLEYARLGNNVRLSVCTILGNDGSINCLNKVYGKNAI